MQPWMDKTLKYNKHGRPTSDNPKDKLYVISSDTDGVLANWVKGFLQVYNQKFDGNLKEEQWVSDQPWLLDPPLMSKEQFEQTFDDMLKIPEFYLNLEPYKNVDLNAINEDLGDA